MTAVNWLMCVSIAPNATPESADSEPVVVETDQEKASFLLDDGSQLVFDRAELVLALTVPRQEKAA